MGDLVLIFIGAGLVNNLLLTHLLGVCTGSAVSNRVETALCFGLATALVLPFAAVSAHAVTHWILEPLDLQYLETVALVLSGCAVVLLTERALLAAKPAWHARIAAGMPLVMLNSALLGAALLAVRETSGIASAFAYGLGAGVGFALVLAMLAAIEERIAVSDIPAPFRGAAITLITLGLLSMAFMGFTGLS